MVLFSGCAYEAGEARAAAAPADEPPQLVYGDSDNPVLATPVAAEPAKPQVVEPEPPPVDPLLAFRGQDQHLAGATSAANGARWRMSSNGLPRNSRQVDEGYWIGAEPKVEHIEELVARGIRVIVSGTRIDQATRDLCERFGIRHVDVPFGGRFPDSKAILAGTEDVQPGKVFIHCEHGGDRSGAVLAFLLSVRHDWKPHHALLAVALPSNTDITGLIQQLDVNDIEVTKDEEQTYAGIYSAERNGGFGGLKVRGPTYRKLVNTTVAAMVANGVRID